MNVIIHFCPNVIRLSAPSLARGLDTKKGEREERKELRIMRLTAR
jgi:hypothetical protein